MKSSSLSTAPLSRGKYVVQQSIFSGYVKRKMTQTNAGLTFILGLRVQDYSARNYRHSFRYNKPKKLVLYDWKRAFWTGFQENWVYKFEHSCQFRSIPLNSCYALSSGSFYTLLILYSQLRQFFHSTQIIFSAQGTFTLNLDYILGSGKLYAQLRLSSQLMEIIHSTQIILSAQATFTLYSDYTRSSGSFYTTQIIFSAQGNSTLKLTQIRLNSQLREIIHSTQIILSAQATFTLSSGQ